MEQHIFIFTCAKECATKKVSPFMMPLEPIYNKHFGFNEQKCRNNFPWNSTYLYFHLLKRTQLEIVSPFMMTLEPIYNKPLYFNEKM